MASTKKIKVSWLLANGVHSRHDIEDYYDSPIVEDVDYWTDNRKVILILKDDGQFWKLEVEHHPEDWSGTNDLKWWAMTPDLELTVVEVELKNHPVWMEK